MANKRTRDRQLAKLAARRQAERRVRRRRRAAGIAGGAVLALAAMAVAFFVFVASGDEGARARSTPTPTPTGAPSVTGTIQPGPAPKQVACDGKVPKVAGKAKPQYSNAPPLSIDTSAIYVATMQTSCGTIQMRLFADKTPVAVNSFAFLAKHGFFDGLRFHRVVPGFVIQAGDPTGTGTGGPGYRFPNEVAKGEQLDRAGVLAMANSGPDTNGSQFFITLDTTPQLAPDQYSIFGEVTKGLDVARRIAEVPAKQQQATESVYIDSLRVRQQKP